VAPRQFERFRSWEGPNQYRIDRPVEGYRLGAVDYQRWDEERAESRRIVVVPADRMQAPK
jgi:hypothetical protein